MHEPGFLPNGASAAVLGPLGGSRRNELIKKHANRPSLFLNNSKSTAGSLLSLNKLSSMSSSRVSDSGDDTSDISADESEDEAPLKSRFAEFSGSESLAEMLQNASKVRNNIFFISNSPSSPDGAQLRQQQQLPKQDHSLFASKDAAAKKEHLACLSSTDVSEDESDDMRPPLLVSTNVGSSAGTRRNTTDEGGDSEWISVSSGSELVIQSPLPDPLNFAKRIPNRSATVNSGDPPDFLGDCGDSPAFSKPRSLLSGMFVSPKSVQSTSLATLTAPPKPVLKRSSTTGVMVLDKTQNSNDLAKSQKRSILFSKRYASLTDIVQNLLISSHRSPVLFVEEDNVLGDDIGEGERNLFAKQSSVAEISNFLATANSSTNLHSMSTTSSSEILPEAPEKHLSSSLNRFSTLHAGLGGSLKSLLSRSSKNLTSLFGLAKLNRLRPQQQPQQHQQTTKSPTEAENLLFEGYLLQQHSEEVFRMDAPAAPKLASTKPMKSVPVKEFQPSVEISQSLKDSVMIDHKLGKIAMPDRVYSDEDFGSVTQFTDNDDYHSKGW